MPQDAVEPRLADLSPMGASAGEARPAIARRRLLALLPAGLAAGLLPGATAALAQTDGELTRMLRELAPHDRAGARRPAPRRLTLRGQRSVTVDMSRRIDVTVFFDLNSAQLRPDARFTLLRLARALNDPSLARDSFLIAGHTSADGDYDFNVALSHDRAGSVRDWLIAEGGVDPGRLTANGFGPDLPRNARNPASPVNRRVEIIAVAN